MSQYNTYLQLYKKTFLAFTQQLQHKDTDKKR